MTTETITFSYLCNIIQQIRETRSTNAKTELCASMFESIKNDDDLRLAAQFIGEGAFENISGKRASVGSRTSGLAAAKFCGIDYDRVFKPSRTATGSSSETIERLIANIPEAINKRNPRPLSLKKIQQQFEKLYKASSRTQKELLLWEAWKQMEPVEIKYFIRMMSQGSLRIGFETRSVTAAIAQAFDQKLNAVRYAHMITGSIGKTAVLAKNNQLDAAQFRLFHPLSFMLASPIESRSVDNLEEYIAEEKFDGMRAQLHTDKNRVVIFSRDLNNITQSFPDLVQFFEQMELPSCVLDGEICVYFDQIIQPFQYLQKRMGLKKPSQNIFKKYPVLFVAYDLLFFDGNPVFDYTLTERRKLLETLTDQYSIPVTTQFPVKTQDDLKQYFERALKHGNEGLMLKKKASTYEYGQRKKSWLKVKEPGGSLDTVIMYAHAGSGKRGGTYSDFTLGISVKKDERYEEEFIPIGKAYGGYTNEDLKVMNQKIKDLTVEKYGPTLGLIPKLVVEIEFDDIRVNKRTKAGYTLRFPRFRAIRWDLGPEDVNTLTDVELLFQKKLNQKRLPQKENPSFRFTL